MGVFNEIVFLHDDPRHPDREHSRPVPWPCTINKNDINIIIDTNSAKPYISLDLIVNGPYSDPQMNTMRVDRILSFHLIFSADINLYQLYQLKLDSVHKEFVSIEIKNFGKPQHLEYRYYNTDVSQEHPIYAQLKIDDYDKNLGVLSFSMDIMLPDPIAMNYQTRALSGQVSVFFKK